MNGGIMRKRILALLLCVCMAVTCFAYSAADAFLNGDANGDGKVSAADAALALRYIVGLDHRMTTHGKMQADIDLNGSIDADDAAAILRHVARLQTIGTVETDAELLQRLNQKSMLDDRNMTEWVARFIQALPSNSPYRTILYEGAKYLGRPYSEFTCDQFVSAAYNDAGIPKTVYPQLSSNNTLDWFREKDRKIQDPDQKYLQSVVIKGYDPGTNKPIFDTSKWKPGCVLLYTNPSNNRGNHLALYVGCIDGTDIIMDSGTSDGVRLIELWEYSNWKLSYYIDPLK